MATRPPEEPELQSPEQPKPPRSRHHDTLMSAPVLPAPAPAYGPPPRFRQTSTENVKPSWFARLAALVRRRRP
jgi:hypothetical protein